MTITVGRGWYRGRLPGWTGSKAQEERRKAPAAVLACLKLSYEDGSSERICSDESWSSAENQIRFAEIYDGKVFDASFSFGKSFPVKLFDGPTQTLIPQQVAEIREQAYLSAASVFTTPAGETVVDLGQEITG